MKTTGSSEALPITRPLLPGLSSGDALILDESLSFWGGLDPFSGTICDVHHPQFGCSIKQALLFIPGTRGSTAGPGALLEAMFLGNGPAGIVLTRADIATVIAVSVAKFINTKAIPIVEADASLIKSNVRNGQDWELDSFHRQLRSHT